MPIADVMQSRRREPDLVDIRVKVHPILARAALNQRFDRQLRVWLLCRALDTEGSGRVSMEMLEDAAQLFKGMAPVTLKGIIRSGEGMFWRRAEDWLYLCGLKSVAESLGLTRLDRHPIMFRLPVKLKDFRAVCTFSFDREFPIANETIARGIKRHKQTVRNYKKALGRHLETKYRFRGHNMNWPNIYTLKAPRGNKGMTRRVNRAICTSLEFVPREQAARYLKSAILIAKRLQALVEGDWFVDCSSWIQYACWNRQWYTS